MRFNAEKYQMSYPSTPNMESERYVIRPMRPMTTNVPKNHASVYQNSDVTAAI